MIDYLGKPRIVTPPSMRYRNWRTLPVEGSREDIRCGLRYMAYGVALAAFVLLFLVVRH